MTPAEQAKQVAARLHLGILIANSRTVDQSFVPLAKEAADSIDALRAVLQERDAEIGLLNGTLESRNRNIEALHAHRHAREDVISDCKCALEHVLDALTTVYGLGTETPIVREIQEILK